MYIFKCSHIWNIAYDFLWKDKDVYKLICVYLKQRCVEENKKYGF